MKANIGIMLDYYSILDDLFVGQTNQVVQQRYKTMSYPLEIRNLVTKTMEVLSLIARSSRMSRTSNSRAWKSR